MDPFDSVEPLLKEEDTQPSIADAYFTMYCELKQELKNTPWYMFLKRYTLKEDIKSALNLCTRYLK